MSTSAINYHHQIRRHYNRTFLVSLFAVCFLIVFNQIYQIFGHGQTSFAMQTAFVYPLMVSIFYLLLRSFNIHFAFTSTLYRIGYNLIHSSTATLSTWALIKGIFEIAGTNSRYLNGMLILGGSLLSIGITVLIASYHLGPTKN